jgi:glycerol kinase
MTDRPHLLAIDQGTTSSRAILFNASAEIVATAQRGLTQIYPRDGWVEQDPEQLWQATLAACRTVFADDPERAQSVVAIGIANQRETTLVWDRATSKPLGNAIGWQDRRTAGLCDRLRREGHEPLVTQKTGLVLDPYFSATKIAWILDNIDGARAAADRGELAFGTVDSYCSISAPSSGTTTYWRCSAFLAHCCRRSSTARMTSATRTPPCSAGQLPSPA